MRYIMGFIGSCLLVGCAGSPPKPPTCEGDFRPVNHVEQKGALVDAPANTAPGATGGKHE